MHYVYLGLAILCEVIGTSALEPAKGFTKLWPSVVVTVAYGLSFLFLSRSLGEIPVGVAYATWSGVGTALIVMIGFFVFKQKIDLPGLLGIGLIIAGVVLLHGFSSVAQHGS